MKNNAKQKKNDDLDVEQIKLFMSLSVREKLRYLEELNQFLQRTMPKASKKNWEKLKQQGF